MRLKLAVVAFVCLIVATTASAQINSDTIIKRLGYPADSKLLIIHADDFGMAHSVDRAIMQAFDNGWITSASIMVPCPWFPEAAEFARNHPQADLGLHLTLTSEWMSFRWRPVSATPVPSLLDQEGYMPLTETDAAAQEKIPDVRNELRAQIEKAKAAGVNFTHLDSHMGTLFQTQALFNEYQKAASDYHVPNFIASGENTHGEHNFSVQPDKLVVTTDLQMTPGVPKDQWLVAYKKMLTGLKPGVYQLIVHLGFDDPELQAIAYNHPDWGAGWRENDVRVVSSREFQQFLKDQGFKLVTWRELAKAMQ
jgi:chitin disaccharide deacetylase